MKKLVLALILTLGVALLTGCYGESTSVTIKEDGSGTMDFSYMVESSVYKYLGGDSVFSDITDAGFTKSTTSYNDSTYVCLSKSVTFSSSDELKGILTSDRKFGKKFLGSSTSEYAVALFNSVYVTADTFQGAYSGNISSETEELGEDVDMFALMSITFDNEVVDTNGTKSEDNKTVSWTLGTSLNETLLQASTVGASAYPVDKTKPVIDGAKNGAYYDDFVYLELSDNVGIQSATLNGTKISNEEIIMDPGKYKVVVTDFAGNKTTITFILDFSAPTVSGVKNNSYYNTAKTITFKDNRAVKSATLNGKTVKSGKKVTKPGKYTLKVTDLAGNTRKVTFTIDKSKPTVSGVKNGSTYSTSKTIKFSDNRAVKKATLNGKTIKSGKKVTASGSYTLKVTDKAGNTTTIKFKIKK